MSNDLHDFLSYIFPDYEEETHESIRNPELSTEIMAILEEVSCATGVPMEYLYHAADLTLRGVAGLQCLWFLHDFSADVLDTDWSLRISANPYDVLRMSFGRKWTSCMAPYGFSELGPLTDMAAGAACLFWYKSNESEPSGRVILRPILSSDLEPQLYLAKKTWGVGPWGHEACRIDEVAELLPTNLPIVSSSLCAAGTSRRALSRYVFCDNEHHKCTQSDDEYEEAYGNLMEAKWPQKTASFPQKARKSAPRTIDIAPITAMVVPLVVLNSMSEEELEAAYERTKTASLYDYVGESNVSRKLTRSFVDALEPDQREYVVRRVGVRLKKRMSEI